MNQSQTKAWRNDAVAKVTGRAKFTDDLKVSDVLHAVPVYCEYVHARIRSISTDKAEKLPGVVRVITAKDIPGSICFGQILKDYRMLADKTVRTCGDVLAIVVAQDRQTAKAAAKAVSVEAVELPVVSDPEEALKPNATLIHPDHGSNITNHHKIRRGDIEKGFAESDVILEQEFRTQHVEHAYMEPEAALCIPRADGVMEVYGSMQHPFSTRRFTAAILGVPLCDVEVKTIPMGGGFGGKDDTAALVCARAALAARLTGQKVKMTYDREWSMRESYKRHPYRVAYKMGLTQDGKIKAMKVRIVADAGAYCSVTPWVTWRSTVQCCGPYCVENVHCDTYGVYTNNVFTGAFRGFGSPQINFCIEQLVEMAAERLEISPIEFRRKNMVHDGSTTITGQVLDNHTVSMEQVLDAVITEIDYDEKLARCSYGRDNDDEWYGIGLAMSYRGVSLGAEGMDFNSAVVNVQFDGSILLEAAVHENGQGAETAMIMILAHELGVSKERIRYRQPSTSNIPDGGTTVASRGTIMGGSAVVDAATNLKRHMAAIVAPRLGCKPEDIIFKDDRLYHGKIDQSISFDETLHHMFLAGAYPYHFGTFKAPDVSWDEETGSGNAYFSWVYGCQAVELTVNRKKGAVTLLNAVAAHDVGRAINPPMIKGQFYGGMAMGIGYALHEEVLSDEGNVTSLNFNKYRIPRARNLPEMTGIIVENPDPTSLCGAKSIGEPTLELMAPAIANAVYRATGKRYFTLPIKVEV